MKRTFDLAIAITGLICFAPLLLPVMFLVWREDGCSPIYSAPRVGTDGRIFQMVKLRTMVVNADKMGVDSTSSNDRRITPIGHFIRRYKLDEIAQLWNVLKGDMTLVGPRPNVKRETDCYTNVERRLLAVPPGITDFASIVFSDEGDVLKDHVDPDLSYNQLIRPGKSALGLFYITHRSFQIDIEICRLTAFAAIGKRAVALDGVVRMLERLGAPESILVIARRATPLTPTPPPGATRIVTTRDEILN